MLRDGICYDGYEMFCRSGIVLLIALIISCAQAQPVDHRTEPPWAPKEFKEGRAEFRAVRLQIQKQYGAIPENALSDDDTMAKAALATYGKTRRAVDAFKAVYLSLTTRNGLVGRQFKIGVDPFKDMPSSDYEVARLRFIWEQPFVQYNLRPLGERLLRKNPNDAEVLWAHSYICTHYLGAEQEGLELAEKVVKLAPCVRTYVRAADARATMYVRKKQPEDAEAAVRHFGKYFASARKDDPARDMAQRCLDWLKKQGF